MKRIVLSGIAVGVMCAATAFAQTSATSQTPSTPGQSTTNQTITMSGCVGGGTNAQPFVLSNPIVLPSGGATTPAGSPSSASATAAGSTASTPTTQPPTSTPPTSATPP